MRFTLGDTTHLEEHNRLFAMLPGSQVVKPTGEPDELLDLVPDGGPFTIPAGDWLLTEPLVIGPEVSLRIVDHTSRIIYSGTGAALTVTAPQDSECWLPAVVRPSGSRWWEDAAEATGVQILNTRDAVIHAGRISGFHVGLDVVGDGTGTVYNTVHLGRIVDNRVGLRWHRVNEGWCNSNLYLGGRIALTSSAPAQAEGTRMILSTSNSNNGNTMVGTSVEGGTVELTAEVRGWWNTFMGLRWEASPGLWFPSGSGNNTLLTGYGVRETPAFPITDEGTANMVVGTPNV